MLRTFFIAILVSFLIVGCTSKSKNKKPDNYTTWSSYLGDPGRSHYSTLSEITPKNIKQLKLAWSYSTADWGQMQMNPIVVDTMLYGVTAALRAFAVHASTGKEIWQFGDSLQSTSSTSRGVSFWSKENDKRIFYTSGPYLYALNALTGKPITTFGDQGKIDLHSGMPDAYKDNFVISSTPGTIYKDLIIMPLRLSEDAGSPPGNLMAFNVITGKLAWVFHNIPHPNEPGHETWEDPEAYKNKLVGAANNWAGMAVDEKTGIIYVPTGSSAPDFYGSQRKGSNLFANCLLALDANTGKLVWYYQFTHHDIWDRDLPAPPNLLTVERKGQKIRAVAQVTKQGYVYVFDRRTGEPLFDIKEVPVPPSTLEGEEAWQTQPFPIKPKPFARQSSEITKNDISPYADNQDSLRTILVSADKRIYAPPSLDPVFLFPGYDGGAEWGGTAADPEDGIIYVNSNEMAWIMRMEKTKEIAKSTPLGETTYLKYCVICHQANREGLSASGFPALTGLKNRLDKIQVSTIIKQGKGMMTGFPELPKNEKEALLKFLYDEADKKEITSNSSAIEPLPYTFTGYHKFLDSNGLPAISPPWGTLNAIDLNTGNYIWSVPFGETMSLKEKGFPQTGCENYGGAVVTQNGLLFIAATKDGFFRVYDKYTGKVLWEYKLPAPAFATPAMYEVNGKQYIAIACGGEKLGTEKGNQIVAFALGF